MDIALTRDYLMTAAIFGVFAFSWFGWAQEKPPKSWVIPLGIASGIGIIIASIGGYLASQNWSSPSALSSDGDYKVFGVIVAIEVLSIFIGSLLLLKKRMSDYVSTWISFVVGVHFLPLVFVFDDPWFYLLTALTIAGSLMPLRLAKQSGIAISALTGVLVGSVILLFAVRGLILYALA